MDTPPPPRGPKSFNYMQFFWEFWQNRMLAPHPTENPGSASVKYERCGNTGMLDVWMDWCKSKEDGKRKH